MRGANYPAVTDKDILRAEIPLPPLDKQRRIVSRIKDCLERVAEMEELRAKQEAGIALLSDAVVDALVSDSWPTRRLGEIATEMRNGWSGKQNANGREFAMLRLSCVHEKRIDASEVKMVKIPGDVATEFLIRKDDVLVVRGNGSPHLVGRSAIVEADNGQVIFSDLLIRLRFTEKTLPAFVNLVFHTRRVRDQIQAVAKTAAGIWKINQTGLNGLSLPCPELSEQARFVEKASTTLQSCAELKSSITETEIHYLREAILRKAFAGEL
jgi:type I restriction enzyme S subunit